MSIRRIVGDGPVRALRRHHRQLSFALAVAFTATTVDAGAAAWLVTQRFEVPGVQITSIAVDAQGDNVVAGIMFDGSQSGIDSGQFSNAGASTRFVARYDGLTGARQFIALVGQPFTADWRVAMQGLAVDASGNAYVPAFASSLDYPATGGTYVARGAAYVYKVTALGQVARLSGPLDPAIRTVRALAVDPSGNVYLTGSAGAGLVTTVGAAFATPSVAAGCIAPYAMKLDRNNGAPLYITYLGYSGTQGERCGSAAAGEMFAPGGYAIAVDSAGNAHVTGQAEPGMRATPGAVDMAPKIPTTVRGGPGVASHAFVAKLNAAGTALVYAARLGGNDRDRGTGIAVDGAGNAYVAGKTTGYTFPTPGTQWSSIVVVLECLLGTPELGFLAKISPDASRLLWAGQLPVAGRELDSCNLTNYESPLAVVADATGGVFTLGSTESSNRDATVSRNALQPVYGDAHFAQVDGNGQMLYSTWLSRGTDALAADGTGNLRMAGGSSIQQISPASLPLGLASRPDPACSGTPTMLDVAVAGAGGNGAVDIQVDGVSMGFAGVRGGIATLAIPSLAPGIRRVTAVYHGPGMFDGYASSPLFLAVNQPGACS